MNFLDVILPILTNVLLIGLALIMIKYTFSNYYFNLKKKELLKIDALIASCKLKLKQRLSIRYKDSVNFGTSQLTNLLIPMASEILALNFKEPGDYQTLLNIFTQMISARSSNEVLKGRESIKDESKQTSLIPAIETVQKTCEDLFKFDTDVVCLIIEITRFTDDYIKKATKFNTLAKLERGKVNSVEIPSRIHIDQFFILETHYNAYKAQLESNIAKKDTKK